MKKNILKIFMVFVFLLLATSIIAINVVTAFAVETNTPVSASTEVNVYDAETLQTYLEVENTDIILWQNITLSNAVSASCNSINLNGYKLTFLDVTLTSDKKSFSIFDTSYSKVDGTSTGNLHITDTLNIGTSNLIIESGVVNIDNGIVGSGDIEINDGYITIKGKDGVDGTDGYDGTTGVYYQTYGGNGRNGSAGTSGNTAIDVSNLYIYGGYVYIIGGNAGDGGNGGNGGKGYDETDGMGGFGGYGADGGDAGSSGAGIIATNDVVILGGEVNVIGGSGGNGGNGGNGGDGGKGSDADGSGATSSKFNGSTGGYAGDGADGGSNSCGREAVLAENFIIYAGKITATGGNGGNIGLGGIGGKGGKGGAPIGNGQYGRDGYDGENGSAGGNSGNGGSGINADTMIYGGIVEAIGGDGAAGIGGSGYGYGVEIDGHNVNISGGNVTVTGGSDSFDIGGGYNGTKIGKAGTLVVTGGTVSFSTKGRATNVSSPSYTNCTITGNGAYQHEGTYDNNGKFSISVNNIAISPEVCVGYEKVTLQAILSISRVSNISTPTPQGYILFKIDGNELGTATIENAVVNGTEITAIASIDWIVVEGDHIITAEYIAGSNDKYGSAGCFELKPNITAHSHDWNDDFTVDVKPSCLTVGSKSIHCKICNAQKDITEIPETGHNYVNNQCENCKEFLPLIVFKDYDGTILSSNYYYIGDTISVPDAPTRLEDNTYTYTFIGWDQEIIECNGDRVYTAVYESIFKNYTITFKNWDNTVLLTKDDYHYGDVVTPPTLSPTKPSDKIGDYIFTSWDSPVGNCDGDKIYTAIYSTSYKYYTVEFRDWNDQIISSNTYKYGEVIEVPENPNKQADMIGSYIFNGWDKNITVCDGNKVYTATYITNYIDYTITFKDWDNSIINTKTYHYGDVVTTPNDPIRAADYRYTYTFKSWDKEVVACAGDATYTATYNSTYIDYTVIFKNEDGSVISTKTYHYGDTVKVPETPTKPANNTYTYTFAGWDSEVVACDGDKVYTAIFMPVFIEYTVIFKDWNGNEISSNKYHYGQAVTKPSNPTRAADNTYTYTFAGWDKTVTVCTESTVYTATYSSTYIDYEIIFKNYDGRILSSETYHYGEAVVVPEAPTKSADESYTYEFAGWDSEVTACLGNKTYMATFNPTNVEYTVVFKDWNGNIISSETYYFGAEVVVPENPTRNADNIYTYTFKNWGKTVAENCVGDAEYTAVYEATYIEYNIKFLDWDGSVIQTVKYHYGDTITAIADPERASDETYTYTFLSWNKLLGTCTGNASFTAQYESTFINYTVVFKDYDGSVISRKTYHFGDPITIPADSVRASDDTYSYTFKDWGNISTSCNGNKEYTANYDAIYIDYTVVFKASDGSVLSTKTYHYGDAVSAPEAPTKGADDNYTYTFKAWDKEVVACVGDAVYTAVYTSTKIEGNDSTETPTIDNTTDKSDSGEDKSDENKVTETDAKSNSGCGGCGSSTALSALAIVAVIGSAIVIKKKED